jgi:hypothetical protein
MDKGVPIRPEDIPAAKEQVIPSFVFDAFNECIGEQWDYKSKRAKVLQKDVIAKIKDKMIPGKKFEMWWWLDVEPAYEAQGWKVHYDKPAYCETYDAFFVFEIK